MYGFGRQNLAAAFQYLTFALTARTLATASGRQVYAGVVERGQQRATCRQVIHLVAVDGHFHITAGHEETLGYQQNHYEEQYHYEEYCNRKQNLCHIHSRILLRS